ncbi:MAG TPA: NADH-ubiquinone oxidoreductase-F iron-sulfur binding region domain-containing protein, partial [Candidatus Polarisedimenticolia bacterium]|nr:NADH-ubiquinone oxidoreductase-F iron-sulfur binding region domain-containing protein [Candidatus Polarisedimenticolia bacterium]
PPADAYGVASFYAMLATAKRPPLVAHVCDDLACRRQGAEAICADLAKRLGPAGTPALKGTAMWQRSPCLGLCEKAPALLVQAAGPRPADRAMAPVNTDAVLAALREAGAGTADAVAAGSADAPARRAGSPSAPQTLDARRAGLRLLKRVGHVDPESLDDYRAHGGYRALRKALDAGPEKILREVLDSRLMGRGGAAFPTGRKWDAVARNPVQPHYVVCNADESEPGTFKDRVLLEEDPFAIVEAMTIAGIATGSEQGWLYVRGEYPLALRRFEAAVARARERGFLGPAVLGEPYAFDIEVRRGAGAYICGEETALFNSIEGLRGEPRNKPPFPVNAGLFGKPTAINNVETLANLPGIVLEGGPAFAAVGTEASTGPKLFCVSGSVARPGVYEVPFGVTLAGLLDLAGGMRPGRSLRAILLGGAAGSFVGEEALATPLTFEGTRAIGASLGSGVVLVYDDQDDLDDALLRIAAFFRDESCGQCVPCRVGTQRQEELLARLKAGRTRGGRAGEIALLDEIAQAMRDASICGLGQTASGAIQSAIRKLGAFGGGAAGAER